MSEIGKRVECKCLWCEKPFSIPISRFKAGRGKYCSRSCASKHIHSGRPKPKSKLNIIKANKVRAENNYSPWNKAEKVKIQCRECGNIFEVVPSRKNKAKYCSISCSNIGKSKIRGKSHPLYTKVDKTCLWCGKVFQVKKAKIDYGEGKFCSRNCQGAFTAYNHIKEYTSIEIIVAKILDKLNIEYKQQYPVGPFVTDFFIPSHNLVIEADGDYWHSLPEVKLRDQRKNGFIKKSGYNLLRLKESEIRDNAEQIIIGALNSIEKNIMIYN